MLTATTKGNSTIYFSINQDPLLDAASRLRIKQEFDELSSRIPGSFKVDMSGIYSINSSGLALLIELKKISFQKELQLEFINMPQSLLHKVEEAGLAKVLFCA